MLKKPQPFITILLFFISFFLLLFTYSTPPVFSNSLFQLEKEIKEKEKEIEQKENILNNVERRIKEINGSNYSISQKVQLLSEEMDVLGESIEKKEEETEKQIVVIDNKKKQLKETKILIDDISGELYIQSRYKIVSFFMNENNWGNIMEGIFIKKSMLSILRSRIEKMGGEFSSLTESKADLDREMKRLKKQKEDLNEAYKMLEDEKVRLQAELSKQTSQQKALTIEIGGLAKEISQLQQFLISVKSGGTVVNVGDILNVGVDVQSTADYFRNNAPAGSFAVFSFGAYTWRQGLSQYGADMRAQLGQNYQDILSAYYSGAVLSSATIPSITVRSCHRSQPVNCKECSSPTYSTIPFESEYMKKIAEMPEDFSFEALKAQAVSARTYAIWKTDYGKNHIDDDECDQVYNPEVNKPNWESAVSATKNQVLIKNGGIFKTSYAAVHGGYSLDTGWDSVDKSSNISEMYEAKSTRPGSYWFYRQWFRYGYSASGNDCGHTSPWLSNGEMADILNGYLRLKDVKSDPRVIAIDITKCWGRAANPYSHEELRNLVPNPVTRIDSVITENNANATTTKIYFNTNRGRIEITGSEFKTIFALRAPAYFRIPQNGSIVNINIEKK